MQRRNGHSANGHDGVRANGSEQASLPVDWERLARAILGMDGGRTLSPSDLSQELQIPLSNTNYHVTELAKAKLIELARQCQVRGATEHFYRIPTSAQAAPRVRGKRTTGLEPATSSLGSSRSTS